jgi:hypothetical protein
MGISVIARKARGPLMAITQLDRKTINHTASQHLGTWTETNSCTYTGTLTPDGLSASGVFWCTNQGNGRWSASIAR